MSNYFLVYPDNNYCQEVMVFLLPTTVQVQEVKLMMKKIRFDWIMEVEELLYE